MFEIPPTAVPSKTAPEFFNYVNCPASTNATLGEAVELFCPCTAGDIATKDVSLEWFKLVNSGGGDLGDAEVTGYEVTEWVPVAELGENGTTYTLGQPQLDLV